MFYVHLLGRPDIIGRDKPIRFGEQYERGWCFGAALGQNHAFSTFATKPEAIEKARVLLGTDEGVWDVREVPEPEAPVVPTAEQQLQEAVARSIENWPHDRDTALARAMGHHTARPQYAAWLGALAQHIRELPADDTLLAAFKLAEAPVPYRPAHGSQQHAALADGGVYPSPEESWRALVLAAQGDFESNPRFGEPLLDQLAAAEQRRDQIDERRAALDALLTATP